ncbi:F0F1-type ATP synthase membrane subunit b/b' [Chryseobacterium sediminis]|uniref:F0F1-type ATP synthase membrane subunit b/b n=1 Tax=Chryseobacterium sediminis TaxID=1679494 RepID=A0ABR6PYI6_9FLAO|nr:hypothetical protein [Chryseobacterium sediminis]MBB6330771.1 F0F1-type ATP synthase membrane subunit b/b' [Chryseobacterium sediminis]
MKYSFLNDEFIIIAGSLIAILFILLSVIMVYIKKRSRETLKERYDYEIKMAELECIKKNLDLQLYDVNQKLEEIENRWKDINHVLLSQNSSEIPVEIPRE